MSELMKAGNNQDLQEEVCGVCYENPLIDGDENTFEFGCGHKFCTECAQAGIKINVERNQLSNLKCLQALCGYQMTDEETLKLFQND